MKTAGASDCRKSSIMEKVAQINSTVKVSSTFSKVAGSRGGAPRRPPQRAKSPFISKNGAKGEKCESISRGGVGEVSFTRSHSPFNGADLLNLQNVPVERFGQSNAPKLFVQFVQNRYLFRQTDAPAVKTAGAYFLYYRIKRTKAAKISKEAKSFQV